MANMRLGTLLLLQAAYAILAIAFLLVSIWRSHTYGAPLSPAPIPVSITAFIVYSATLLLAKFDRLTWYRIAMAFWVVLMGSSGVIGNAMNFIQTGTEGYSSLGGWIAAIGINSYGLIWNVIAALGRYHEPS